MKTAALVREAIRKGWYVTKPTRVGNGSWSICVTTHPYTRIKGLRSVAWTETRNMAWRILRAVLIEARGRKA